MRFDPDQLHQHEVIELDVKSSPGRIRYGSRESMAAVGVADDTTRVPHRLAQIELAATGCNNIGMATCLSAFS